MKQTSTAQKTSRTAVGSTDRETTAGPNGLSISPPSYGIDAVDNQVIQAAADPAKVAENRTGLPDRLKAGIETLSGLAMDDVRVHYNSPQPAQLHALAYTQGTNIHVAPGQDKHLPHEAWHVVQQKHGRVKPTLQAKGVSINDNEALEREADVMGTKALQMMRSDQVAPPPMSQTPMHLQRRKGAASPFPVSQPLEQNKHYPATETPYASKQQPNIQMHRSENGSVEFPKPIAFYEKGNTGFDSMLIQRVPVPIDGKLVEPRDLSDEEIETFLSQPHRLGPEAKGELMRVRIERQVLFGPQINLLPPLPAAPIFPPAIPLRLTAYIWEDREALLGAHANIRLTREILDFVHDVNRADGIMLVAEAVQPNLVNVISFAEAMLLDAENLTPLHAGNFAALALVTNVTELIQVVALGLLPQDAANLSGMPQVTDIVGLGKVAALNLPVNEIVQLGGLGAHGLTAQPTLAEVIQLGDIGLSATEILRLAGQEVITTPVELIALSNSVTDRQSMGFEWSDSNAELQKKQETWAHWRLDAIFHDIYRNLWSPATKAAQILSNSEPTPAQIQDFLVAKAQLKARINHIDAFVPALDEGAAVLALCDILTKSLLPVQKKIRKLLIYYSVQSNTRTAIQAQEVIANQAILDIAAEKNLIEGEKNAYNLLLDITGAQAIAALADQQAHRVTLNAITTAATIKGVINPYRTGVFNDSQKYKNLNLTQAAAAHEFWQSLTPEQKARLNKSVQEFPVTAWGTQGYPGTRGKQNGYVGDQIQIPTLAGFPVQVGGEIVHDWIFPTPGHGRPAKNMNVMIGHALAGTHLPSPLGPLAPDNQVGGDRTIYGFRNIAANIIITNGGVRTLITFYSTL